MSDLIQKRAKRRRLITRGLLIVGGLAVAFIIFNRVTHQEPPPSYRTAEVTRGDIQSAIVALGTVDAKDYVDVGAQVSGQLQALHFEIGDEVKQGDLVAEIDPLLAQSRVDADRAQLLELEANRRQQLAQLQLAEADAARNRALLTADAISQAEAESSEAALEVAHARIAQLDAQIQRTQSTLEGDLTSLSYTKIYAPISGTVVSHSAVEGQTLNANQTAPVIMRIADLSVMTVQADISEADVPRLRPGLPAYFTTLGAPDREWRATVRQVLPQPEIVNDVVLYKALLDVENPDRMLLPSMSTQVSFVLGEVKDTLKIPAAALQVPPAMLIAAGGRPPEGVVMMGPGGAGAEGMPEAMRERMANMSEEERAEMRQRFQQQGGQAGPGRAGEAGSAGSGSGSAQAAVVGAEGEAVDRTPLPQPDWMTDADTPPRPHQILVMVDGEPQAREVMVGLVSRTEAQVISGLEEGEEIVLGEAAATTANSNNNNQQNNFRPPGGGVVFRGG